MNNITHEKISAELSAALRGRMFGKIFVLGKRRFAIDFRLPEYLFISLEPNDPRIYLFNRKVKELERASINPMPFALHLRKRLSGALLQKIEKVENERILQFSLINQNELGENEQYRLVIQLTGRSANLFLLDQNDFIIDSLKEAEIGTKYQIPDSPKRDIRQEEEFPKGDFPSLSAALDAYYEKKEADDLFDQKAKSLLARLKKEISGKEKLIKKYESDIENHGDADIWKRKGDLLLANLANAARIDDTVLVEDFFDPNVPTVEIEVDRNLELTEAAEKFFKRYAKARNAKAELGKRIEEARLAIEELKIREQELIESIAERDISSFEPESEEKKAPLSKSAKQAEGFRGARYFISSDGLEILVGKASKDNDHLTFKIAKSLDTWLHAADYGGSHVVIRNPSRGEIPQKTLLEAAKLAAFYSQAKEQPKVAVHYTQKKFVNKPKGAAAGLVSLSSFKTILVDDFLEIKVKQK